MCRSRDRVVVDGVKFDVINRRRNALSRHLFDAGFVFGPMEFSRRDLMAVKEPAEHQRRVAFGRRALDDHEVAGVERLIAEGERRDSRRHCQQPKFKNLRRENSLVFFKGNLSTLSLRLTTISANRWRGRGALRSLGEWNGSFKVFI